MAISQPILTTELTISTEPAQRLWSRAYKVVTRSVHITFSVNDRDKRNLLRGIINSRLGVFKGNITRSSKLIESYVAGLSEEEMERLSNASLRYSNPITLAVDVSGLPQTRFLHAIGAMDEVLKSADKLLLLGFMKPIYHQEIFKGLYRDGNRFGLFCGRLARDSERFLEKLNARAGTS